MAQRAVPCSSPMHRALGINTVSFSTKASHSSTADDQVPVIARRFLSSLATSYLQKNPAAASALKLVRETGGGAVKYDHFAFRTFGVHGCGIQSIAQLFLDCGYERRDELRFPAKKLRAFWYSPPEKLLELEGDGVDGPLPRIFISELLVDQLTSRSQDIIERYTGQATARARHAALCSVLGCLPWETPCLEDYQHLATESEYAAWTLVNGYALNHLTVSVHRLDSELKDIEKLNDFLQTNGVKLNSEGGVLKISPDGGLLQSSTVADSALCTFADGEEETVPGSYIEFAQRLPLPQYKELPVDQLRESHRRDGFEVGNADKIFESTSSSQIGSLKAAT